MRGKAMLLIGGPLNGGILSAMIWWVVNSAWKIGGVGLLQRQVWPLSSISACAAIGAALGLALGLRLAWARYAHANSIESLCQQLQFRYIQHVPRELIPRYHGLRLFEPSRWHEASNLMTGRHDGESLDLLDYEYVSRGNDSTTHYRQTVALFAGCGCQLPRFEMVPRGLLIKLLYRAAGLEGVTFVAGENMSEWDRDAIERFRQLYFLTPRLDEIPFGAEVHRPPRQPAPDRPNDRQHPSAEAAIRQLFKIELLRFFADRPGWSVESDGNTLAVWRSHKIIHAGKRDAFLTEACEMRVALLQSAAGERRACTIPGTLRMDVCGFGTTNVAWSIGVVVGGAVGGMIGMALAGAWMTLAENPPRFLIGGVFFACPIVGLITGGLISRRWRRKPRKSIVPGAAEDIDVDSSTRDS